MVIPARAPPCEPQVAPASFNLALGSLALGSVFGVPGSPLKNRVTAFVPGALLALYRVARVATGLATTAPHHKQSTAALTYTGPHEPTRQRLARSGSVHDGQTLI